jgi:hypothetical protein
MTLLLVIDEAETARGFSARWRLIRPTPSPAPDLDCVPGGWGPWGECSKSCGGGFRTRTRAIVRPASGKGTCNIPLEQSLPCNSVTCAPAAPDVNCGVSPWGAWSACESRESAGCGAGVERRTRSILMPASGRGTPCPPPEQLLEKANCTVPCVHPACAPATRPLRVAGGSGSAGWVGIGSPRHAASPAGGGLPPQPPGTSPRFPGNTNCSWTLDPFALGWPMAGAPAPVVNLSLAWIDVPAADGCARQRMTIRSLASGAPLFPPFCGSAFPSELRLAGGSVLSAPGDGFRIDLTVDERGGADIHSGFLAR